jgi:hypothetical protein
MLVCTVEGCGKPAEARGVCNTHYMRLRRANLVPIGTRAKAPVEERFWRYVEKRDEGCWPWVGGGRNDKGYGTLGGGGKGGKTVLAHRLSYEIHKGPIPPGLVVMHSCDNPGCVNPAHLKVGTTAENIKEAYDKGRKVCQPPHKQGEAHGAATITEQTVREIRSEQGKTIRQIARERGLSESLVARVRHRKTWRHID